MRKYRYIYCGLVDENDCISDYRLLSSPNKPGTDTVIWRIHIPNDMELDYCKYDGYSTTIDDRTLKEIGYDLITPCETKRGWERIDDKTIIDELLKCFRGEVGSKRETDVFWMENLVKQWRKNKKKIINYAIGINNRSMWSIVDNDDISVNDDYFNRFLIIHNRYKDVAVRLCEKLNENSIWSISSWILWIT